MIWTDQVPTEPGLYWLSGRDNGYEPQVVLWNPPGVSGTTRGEAYTTGCEEPLRVVAGGDLWCGPILAPDRPQDAHAGECRWVSRVNKWQAVYDRKEADDLVRFQATTAIPKWKGGAHISTHLNADGFDTQVYVGPEKGWQTCGVLRYCPENDSVEEWPV